MKIGNKPRLSFCRDGDRYIVMLGDERAGFARKREDGRWSPADTFMRKSRTFRTRRTAGDWLRKETERAIATGEP